MGTNYFLRYNACGHCERYEEAHIGKQSFGWSFLFRAYEHRLMNEGHPDWGHDPRSPFGFEVRSRADWLRVLAEVPGSVVDEYGSEVEDPVAWLNDLEPPSLVQRRFEDDPRHYPSYCERTDRRDADGFRSESREFS